GGWFDDLAGGRKATTYVCFAERRAAAPLLALNRLGALSLLPRAAFTAGRGKVPDEASREPVAEWVAVRRGGTRVAARTVEGEGDYRSTALSTLAMAEALRTRDERGCFHPEDLFSLADLEPRLRELGVRVVPQPI